MGTLLRLVKPKGITYSRIIKNLSPIAHFPLADASGSVAEDESGHSHDGTLVPARVTYGQPGMGDGRKSILSAGSADEFVQYSAGLAEAFSGNLGTAMGWIKMASAASWADANYYTWLMLIADASNRIFIRKGDDLLITTMHIAGGTAKALSLGGVGQFTTTRWLHFAAVWDHDNDLYKLYLSGVQQKAALTGLGNWAGAITDGSTVTFPGNLAHYAIFPTALSASAIWKLSRNSRLVVFHGDSRMNRAWPYNAADLAFPSTIYAYGRSGVANWATSGWTTDLMISTAPTTVDTLVKSGVSNILVVWIGVNSNGTHTAQEIYDDIHTYCEARKAAGYDKILLCTEIDAVSTGWTAKYQALNALLKADYHFADAIADLGANAHLQDHTNLTYFDADGVHLVEAGNNVVRDIVYPVLATLG